MTSTIAPSAAGLACEAVPAHPSFRALASIVGIRLDLRYASANNLAGRDLYSPLDCAWLHVDAAAALERSVAALHARAPQLQLLILDALRPQRAQEQLWATVAGTELTEYFAPPERGSIHSFGMAVDITLAHRGGDELDMGTPFDDLSALSHPQHEAQFLASGKLAAQHVEHRRLLREVMAAGAFRGISSEWWHFDCGDREAVRRDYLRVL